MQASVTPKRFDTRFFMAVLPEGQHPIHDNIEAIDSIWLSPREALDRYWAGSLPLAPRTEPPILWWPPQGLLLLWPNEQLQDESTGTRVAHRAALVRPQAIGLSNGLSYSISLDLIKMIGIPSSATCPRPRSNATV